MFYKKILFSLIKRLEDKELNRSRIRSRQNKKKTEDVFLNKNKSLKRTKNNNSNISIVQTNPHLHLDKSISDEKNIAISNFEAAGLSEEIIAALIHEINNPLTNIKAYAYQILDSKDEKDLEFKSHAVEYAEKIQKNVNRIAQISRQMRSLYHSRSEPKVELVSIDLFLREIKEDIKKLQVENKVDLEFHVKSKEDEVYFPAFEFRQILMNFLRNACEASRDTELSKVALDFAVSAEAIEIRVQDTGAGISDKDKNNLFKAFYTTKRESEGTGLGLYISQKLAHTLSAKIEHYNRSDSQAQILGSTFVLKWPREAVHKLKTLKKTGT